MLKKLSQVLLLILPLISLGQTGVVVSYYDGSTQNFDLTTSDKLYFSSDNLVIQINGTTSPTTIPVSIIRKITFGEPLVTGEEFAIENGDEFSIFPNPGSNLIRLKSSANQNLTIKIFSFTGQLVHQGNYQTNQDIDVSALVTGLYLIQANGLTIKFSKR